MIIMDVKIDNLYAFKEFHMNMSYPKKVVNSPIDNEFLHERPNFRYRRVNILMGSNATGKTSFGKILMLLSNFFQDGEYSRFIKKINDNTKPAYLKVDFVANDLRLYRFDLQVENKPNSETGAQKLLKIECVPINKNDRYETCAERLDSGICEVVDYHDINLQGWCFQYGNELSESTDFIENDEYTKVLEWVMKTLDPAIIAVNRVENVDNAYSIMLNNQSVIIQNGKFVDENILSSGTKMGFAIAYAIASMICQMHTFYYCDELFTYVNSDIESVCLSLMIEKLAPQGQLFLTTHNSDIAEMDLPKHSFCFLKKEQNKPNEIVYVNASEYLKKNTDSVKNALDNDVFSTAPDVEKLYDIVNF